MNPDQMRDMSPDAAIDAAKYSSREHAHQADGVEEDEVFIQEVNETNGAEAEKMLAQARQYIDQFKAANPTATEAGDPHHGDLARLEDTLESATFLFERKAAKE